MREYRGLTKAGKWVYGWYCKVEDRHWITLEYAIVQFSRIIGFTEVIPETVGQYTGLKDRNDKKIYEGDVLRHYGKNNYPTGHIEYYNGAFCAFWKGGSPERLTKNLMRHFEIIGNLTDNPELLKETK